MGCPPRRRPRRPLCGGVRDPIHRVRRAASAPPRVPQGASAVPPVGGQAHRAACWSPVATLDGGSGAATRRNHAKAGPGGDNAAHPRRHDGIHPPMLAEELDTVRAAETPPWVWESLPGQPPWAVLPGVPWYHGTRADVRILDVQVPHQWPSARRAVAR
jgi:hypothetical protein